MKSPSCAPQAENFNQQSASRMNGVTFQIIVSIKRAVIVLNLAVLQPEGGKDFFASIIYW